jgi:CheY-like chemotaxis protein
MFALLPVGRLQKKRYDKMSKTIMIVEDEQPFHDLYAEMLEDTDYRIIHAYDGDEALSKLEENKPDLIILDIVLDMMTGDTFFLYLKGMPEYADIPVIIVTGACKRAYESLWGIDPNLVVLDKTAIEEKLIATIETKIGEQNFTFAH